MSDRRRAEERMAEAKRLYTRACKAALDGQPLAQAMAATALAAVDEARAELRAADEETPGRVHDEARSPNRRSR